MSEHSRRTSGNTARLSAIAPSTRSKAALLGGACPLAPGAAVGSRRAGKFLTRVDASARCSSSQWLLYGMLIAAADTARAFRGGSSMCDRNPSSSDPIRVGAISKAE